jgi:hypothetical protein
MYLWVVCSVKTARESQSSMSGPRLVELSRTWSGRLSVQSCRVRVDGPHKPYGCGWVARDAIAVTRAPYLEERDLIIPDVPGPRPALLNQRRVPCVANASAHCHMESTRNASTDSKTSAKKPDTHASIKGNGNRRAAAAELFQPQQPFRQHPILAIA